MTTKKTTTKFKYDKEGRVVEKEVVEEVHEDFKYPYIPNNPYHPKETWDFKPLKITCDSDTTDKITQIYNNS